MLATAKDFHTKQRDVDSAYESASVEQQSVVDATEKSILLKARSCSNTAHYQASLKYNQDRTVIARSIKTTLSLASDFKSQSSNDDWPMQIPLHEKPGGARQCLARSTSVSPVSQEDGRSSQPSPPRNLLRRTFSVDQERVLQSKEEKEPSLISAEVKHRLDLLQPEVKVSVHGENILSSMNHGAIGALMEHQFLQAIKHLNKLDARVEDTSSKVLVTGDLNAGKSTLVNALIRQHVLPVDQQPCTEVFCELLDSRDNMDVEEVHAIRHHCQYDRNDSSTFDVLSFSDLDAAVQEGETYSHLKVFVDDKRPIDESLLRNGVVDISLIDAPGLNSDSLKTTAVFARQEEIDVVVFVVSAENHFTLSAKEFLWNAANEKAYLFIVVNRFDNIRNKDKCRKAVLEQVAGLSPKTYENAEDLVHFVSSNSVIEESSEPFAELEVKLRNFVLEKRSESKLAPAKHFVSKLLGDMKTIAVHNNDIAKSQQVQTELELLQINEKLNCLTADRHSALDKASQKNEKTCEQIRTYTKQQISNAVAQIEHLQPAQPYTGLFDCYEYASKLRDQYLNSILLATIDSELAARNATIEGIETIRCIGLQHLNAEQYKLKQFRPEFMFSKKRDSLQRTMPIELSLLDFVDSTNFEALLSTSSLSAALVLYGGKSLGWSTIADTTFRALNVLGANKTPKLLGLLALVAVSGTGYYFAMQIPHALQTSLSRKIRARVSETEYVENNANRISHECRKVLNIPEQELRAAFTTVVDAEQTAKSLLLKRSTVANSTHRWYDQKIAQIAREQKKLGALRGL